MSLKFWPYVETNLKYFLRGHALTIFHCIEMTEGKVTIIADTIRFKSTCVVGLRPCSVLSHFL